MSTPRQPGKVVQPKAGGQPSGAARNGVIQRAAAPVGGPAPAPFVFAFTGFQVGTRSAPPAGGVRRSGRISNPRYRHRTLPLIGGRMIRASSVDKRGKRYWNGYRSTLRFSAVTTAMMGPAKGGGCRVGKGGCSGAANSIDHVVDFATTQSALATRTYCDGAYHWSGILLSVAMNDYNNLGNLQWSCTSCNSSKSGARGLYSPPSPQGACPGKSCRL